MKAAKPLPIAIAISSALLLSNTASASDFFADSTLNLKWKVNYYNLEGEVDETIALNLQELESPYDVDTTADVKYDISIEDLATSIWLNWQSGWFKDRVGIELEYQGALIAQQDGTIDGTATADLSALGAGSQTISLDSANPRYYEGDADDDYIGKLGNANIRLKFGDKKNETQFLVGRYTPTIYNLLHRPDEIYYGMHHVYEGASIQGHYEWSWGMAEPWVNYFSGFSSEQSTDTVQFRDLEDTDDYSSFDQIINIGFHTVTDYFTSSASYSYAEDYLSNGIIEIYSGIPYSLLGWGDSSQDKEYYIKYMVKYGAESGLGSVNDDHKTDVYEFAIGLQHGNLDFLAGVTQIGDESFRGFETQDGYNAGGGTAVWGDVAILNSFDNANQRTYFLTGGYNLDGWNLPNWRVQGVVARAEDTDLSALDVYERISIPNEDYTEVNLDIVYAENGYQGEGFSYLLKIGQDTNWGVTGIGFFIEYNGDIAKSFE